MKIFISSDHAGYELKKHLVGYFQETGIDVVDLGPFEFNAQDDYPDYISLVGEEISAHRPNEIGVVIGHSGQGEALVANKYKNVRAGVYYGGPLEIVKLLREHNNANVLSLSAHFLTPEQAEDAVDTFVETIFTEEDRHMRRIQKIKKLEEKL
jgi:ribose 5-phosphate isomerase B